jgi:hypothetical protein
MIRLWTLAFAGQLLLVIMLMATVASCLRLDSMRELTIARPFLPERLASRVDSLAICEACHLTRGVAYSLRKAKSRGAYSGHLPRVEPLVNPIRPGSGFSVALHESKGDGMSAEHELRVKTERRGASEEEVQEATHALFEHAAVRKELEGARHRLLSFALTEDEEAKGTRTPPPPHNYRATIYDYTNNRTLVAEGRLDKRESVTLAQFDTQPLPNPEEFREAVEILERDRELGPALREYRLIPYAPMPPLIDLELPDGRIERTLAVGLLAGKQRAGHEIVGVNMIKQSVIRFPNRAPAGGLANGSTCGIVAANQGTASRGTPGQVWVTVTQGGTTLWRFLVVRPAASSGTNGSAIELRYVDYRGKRVLYRAHVPILNVRYDADACGPYRDWQYAEGMLQANGTDVAPGFRLCSSPAQTIMDTGSDVGNFLGVAIYVVGEEVVLVSELEAGWYRYICEWRLHADGTIRPRFGFSAVQSSCVCNIHHHHVYWRFDFDIDTPGNNVVHEYNNPPLFPPSNTHTKYYEIRRYRDSSRSRKWQIENAQTHDMYELIPGANDGTADSFGVGDLWVLHYHGNEIDDGQSFTTDPVKAMAHLDTFLTGEYIYEQDVVLWYSAHFTHDVSETSGEIVGPDLRPVRW